MASANHYGTNFMENYSKPGMPLYDVVRGLQQGRLGFDSTILSRARADAQRKSAELDRSTYPFQEDLAYHLFGDSERRVIMFVSGAFHGKESVPTVIPIDLGSNPHQLFQKPGGNLTIDSSVTFDQTGRYLETFRSTYGSELSKLGISEFEVDKSRFFYFRQSDLEDMFNRRLKKGQTISLEEMAFLVPLVISTDRIALTEIDAPSGDVQTPMHVSYRLKQSLEAKLLDRLSDGPYEPRSKVRLIADWVAHRPVLPTIDEVNALESFLKSNPIIGNSRVEYLYTNDYYNENPKKGSGRQFKAKNVIVVVTTGHYEPALREIQIVDSIQYFENELLKGQTSHVEFEKKRASVPRRKKVAREVIKGVLDGIFIKTNDFIPL
ncbi:MAG: hypothetical protein AABX34_06855 [Nanoarchaeota archaeon]